MIRIAQPTDFDLVTVQAVAWEDVAVEQEPAAVARLARGRAAFGALLNDRVPGTAGVAGLSVFFTQ